jgi:hypothetical protein
MNITSQNYPTDTITKMTLIMQGGDTITSDKIDQIMTMTGKSKRSVVAKLSQMGLYKAVPRVKVGKKITKAQVVAQINAKTGVTTASLVKATMTDLQALLKAL